MIWPSAAVGDGPLFPGAQYDAGDVPYSVAIGDLNGDQVPDLGVANAGSDNVSVLLGLGDGTFAAAVHYPAGNGAWSVVIGDLDGDQVPDLALAESYSDNVSVLLGLGDGTFAAAAHYGAAQRPSSVAIGDLNGDQAPDLAVANSWSDNVSVLVNQSVVDCNDNGIPDECDVDCGPPGGPCDLPGCGQSADCNTNGVPDECEADADGDGVIDDCDACPDTHVGDMIVIDGCDTGVADMMPADDGCSMAQQIAECAQGADSHGAFVSCVAHLTNAWKQDELISGQDKGHIQCCAAQADIP